MHLWIACHRLVTDGLTVAGFDMTLMLVAVSSGEFHLRLRYLEKSLLQALNDAKGKILDDDSVITTLETLKKEAAEITSKVEETDKVIAEIETVSQQYQPLAQVRER